VNDKTRSLIKKVNENSEYIDFLNIMSPVANQNSFGAIDESTMKNLMNAEDMLTSALKNNAQQEIKKRASIPVPKSVNLLGVVDWTGTLEHGQVFVQLRRDDFHKDVFKLKHFDLDSELKETELITGKVIVARSPCGLPSEIRTLEAVNATATLGHLVNVVVFSSKSAPNCKKPAYSLMGNGDLDGDIYWVCWDPDLTNTVTQVEPQKII